MINVLFNRHFVIIFLNFLVMYIFIHNYHLLITLWLKPFPLDPKYLAHRKMSIKIVDSLLIKYFNNTANITDNTTL